MSFTPERLLQFIRDELGIDTAEITDDSPLFSSGVIDSFSLVSLLAHLEDTWGLKIGATDVNLDNFDSVSRITAYVSRMSGGQP